ncbi:MAG: hypothetical protein KatS3mg124_0366 [Porticoccaceae bacterium]|nr:MAG: hypothetical protein KatS3mg124_0366 [Porticoccaceae bacterium]
MSDYDAYLDYILTTLRSLKRESPVEIGKDTDLVRECGLSSLQVMELVERIEDHFDISIPLNILPDVSTADDMARKLAELTKG